MQRKTKKKVPHIIFYRLFDIVTAVIIAITLLNINIPNHITKLKDLKPAKCSRPFSCHHCKAVQALPSHSRLHQG